MNRIVDISQEPAKISHHLNNLVVETQDSSQHIPLLDIAALVVSHPQVTITMPALCSLSNNNVVLIICDSRHLPCGMMLPLSVHYAQTQIFEKQSSLPLPSKKRVWKTLIQAKIRGQARTLSLAHGGDYGLLKMVQEVRSGDTSNVEGKAARRYWSALLGPLFRRDFQSHDENAMLNYGYALMRGLVARGLCASGLHPSLGVHHHHRSNPYALADDFIEPFRPLVDFSVWQWFQGHDISEGLSKEGKSFLICKFLNKYEIHGQYKTLFSAVNEMASSFAKVCKGEQQDISIPSILHD